MEKMLVNFEKYHNMAYAKLLEHSGLEKEWFHTVETFLEELVQNSDISIRVRIDALESIINDNEVKSVIETGSGATLGGKKARIESLRHLFNPDFTILQPRDYPKYGYLSMKDKYVDFFHNADLDHQYGNVCITLKKEKVEDRTTMTVGDSINFGEFYQKIPTFITSPKALCIQGAVQTIMQKEKSSFPALKKLHSLIISGQLTVQQPNSLPELFDFQPGFEFYELQIHGEINIERDVASVDFWANSREESLRLEVLSQKLEKKGVSCKNLEK